MSDYAKLLEELRASDADLAKSHSAAAQAVAAPAGESDDLLAKAITVVDEEGNEYPAFDAEVLIKAFHERIDAVDEDLSKALGETLMFLKSSNERLAEAQATIQEQGSLIKSLSERVEAIAGSGSGRRSTLSVHEKPSAAPQEPDSIKPSEFLAKAEAAMVAGRILPGELIGIEARLNRGVAPDESMIKRVIGE